MASQLIVMQFSKWEFFRLRHAIWACDVICWHLVMQLLTQLLNFYLFFIKQKIQNHVKGLGSGFVFSF
jgi:hypothetical protein